MKKTLAAIAVVAMVLFATSSPPSDYWAAEAIPSYDCIDPDYPFEAYL